MKKFALIVAGGSGSRMKSDVPKQFILLNGTPMLMHTFNAFMRYDSGVEFILVLPEAEIPTWEKLCFEHSFDIPHSITSGGKTRFHSVKNGLKLIQEEGIVFIHDGVRPLVSTQTLATCYQTALEKGNALPVIVPSESVREVINTQNRAVDRSCYFLVQTPQTFQTPLIKKAYEQEFTERFTDDASVLENTGEIIYLVQGNRQNIKITYPEDLEVAAILLKNRR